MVPEWCAPSVEVTPQSVADCPKEMESLSKSGKKPKVYFISIPLFRSSTKLSTMVGSLNLKKGEQDKVAVEVDRIYSTVLSRRYNTEGQIKHPKPV